MAPRKPKTVSLTAALSQLLGKTLLPDLQARAQQPAIAAALQHQYESEKKAERTADSSREFVERTLEQVGAAWVLSCVFVRTLEDRKLLARNRLAGEGALDSEQLFFELSPSLTARDYLLTVFQEVSSLPGAADVLGAAHNPVFRLSPSNEGARALLDFFRERGEDGALRWTFAGQDTRFLGDLYQDLSEDVRKRYALLQTPHFVESFILDQTLTPAVAEFGLNEVRVIDPTCGSGHFLLGAFERLLDARLRAAPGVDVRTHALAALGQVYGVDMNPYAVAVARFRLTLAYLSRAGFTLLSQAPRLKLNLVVADSLLHGAQKTTLLFTEHESARGDEAAWGLELFALDDPEGAARIFGQRYHAVVGNPPYITCKDAKLRDAYRAIYKSCYREYSLAAPFTERFFQLAVDGGFVGLINANSFMKREFGSALIEKVLPSLDLTRVIDTAGAYIPGHGTPTVLLFGRNRKPASEQVSAVLGKRGEPSTPEDPEQGLVWRSITEHCDEIGFDNDYITVASMPRSTLNQHPWSLGGGGAAELKELLESRAEKRLSEVVDAIGFSVITGEDNVLMAPREVLMRGRLAENHLRRNVIGEEVRDWSIGEGDCCVWPNTESGERLSAPEIGDVLRYLWPYRTALKQRKAFGTPIEERGIPWWALREVYSDRMRTPLTITFAEVATHNHFVLDRGGKVFKQTAPIIKLPESATEDDHLALLAYLNSSTACFWMKQVFMNKGGSGIGRGIQDEAWEARFQFDGTKMATIPLPPNWQSLAPLGRVLAACDIATRFDQMVMKQETLDWHVYALCGFELPSDVVLVDDTTIRAGTRPFEITLAQEKPETAWFSRNGYALPTEATSPIAKLRISATESNAAIALIEQPEYKHRWSVPEPVAERKRQHALDELLFGVETELSERRVIQAERLRSTPEMHSAGIPGEVLSDKIRADAVPFVSAYRYTDTGLAKHTEWKHTWDLQRREDLGEKVGEIPVPPKYDSKDYQSPDYWRLRGKLDVPKERFISYPGCQKDGDGSPLIGWAGWNHLQRAQALIALYQERKQEDGWPKERLMPMLVGLHELMFWLELWHCAPEAGSQNPAREVSQYLDAELSAHKLTPSDLEAWRPETKKQAKARKSGKGVSA